MNHHAHALLSSSDVRMKTRNRLVRKCIRILVRVLGFALEASTVNKSSFEVWVFVREKHETVEYYTFRNEPNKSYESRIYLV